MPTLLLDIDESGFRDHLVATLTRGKVDFHHAVTTAVKSGISKQIEKLVAAGVCLRYVFKHGNLSRIVSLQEAVEHKGFDFWYLDIQVDLQPGVLLSEKDVLPPLSNAMAPD